MKKNSILTKSQDLIIEELHGETLLLNTNTLDTLHLSASAKVIWGLLDGQRSLADIIQLISDEYPEQQSSITKDVLDAAQKMIDNKLAEYVTE